MDQREEIQKKSAKELQALCKSVKRLREAQGISIEKFSALLHIPIKTLQQMDEEQNASHLTIDELAAISRYFNIRIYDLMGIRMGNGFHR